MTNEELVGLMGEALEDDDKALVLGDYLEARGVEIPVCLGTQGLAFLASLDDPSGEKEREVRRKGRIQDVRVRTRQVLAEMAQAARVKP